MAVLNDIRALFVQFPAMKDLHALNEKHKTHAEGYSILQTGSTIIAQDMTGAATWQYNFVIAATRMSDDDMMRLDNCNFLERLLDWVQEQDRKGVPLTDAEFVRITASDGGISEWDEGYTYGVYKIEGALIYEKE